MKHFTAMGGLFGALSVLSSPPLFAQSSGQPLQIYWIDVEGGSSTLIVTPTREAVLMDAGWNREDERDAQHSKSGAAPDSGSVVLSSRSSSLFRLETMPTNSVDRSSTLSGFAESPFFSSSTMPVLSRCA